MTPNKVKESWVTPAELQPSELQKQLVNVIPSCVLLTHSPFILGFFWNTSSSATSSKFPCPQSWSDCPDPSKYSTNNMFKLKFKISILTERQTKSTNFYLCLPSHSRVTSYYQPVDCIRSVGWCPRSSLGICFFPSPKLP